MLVPMVQRQPKGNSRGGQFAPGDASRDKAGQVAVATEPESYKKEFDGGIANGGSEEWRTASGERHRLDGPAVTYGGSVENGGNEEWYKFDKLHRLDGPAVQTSGGLRNLGSEEHWKDGARHRDGGPAVQLYGGVSKGGSEEYWTNGVKFNPDGGPSERWLGGVSGEGGESWTDSEGLLHREDGPAVRVYDDHESYWLHGVKYDSKEAWEAAKTKKDQQ